MTVINPLQTFKTLSKGSKIGICLLISIAITLLVLFLIPVQQKSFDELYHGDAQALDALQKFREYPIKSLSSQGVDWQYISIGEGKSSLLFLHGMGGGYDIWYQQINALKDKFNIISLTLPKVGSLSQATQGIIQILDHENIDKVSLIGTSMGGYIGQYFLNEHPERLNRVVLGNTFPPNEFYREQNGNIRKLVPFLPEWLIMHIFRDNAQSKVIPASENSQLVNAYLLEQYSGLMSKQQFIGRFDIVLEDFKVKGKVKADINGLAAQQHIPKLIIESDNDPLVEEHLRSQLRQTYGDAQVFTFTGKGHFPYLNRADKYSKVLTGFLSASPEQNSH